MKYSRILSSVILVCAFFSGVFFTSAAADIKIVSIEEIPETAAATGSGREDVSRSNYTVEVRSETNFDAKSDVESSAKSVAKSVAESNAKSVAESSAKSDAESSAKSVAKSVAESSAKSVTKSGAEPKTESVAKHIAKSVAESETESVAKHIAKSDTKPDTESDTEFNAKSDMEPDTESDAESDTGTESEKIRSDKTEMPDETETENKNGKITPDTPQGLYEIASAVDEDFVLDIRHCTVQDVDSQSVQLFRSLNVNQQKFYLETLPDGEFRISVLHTGNALTAFPDENTVAMAAMEHPEDTAAAPSQTWIIEEARHGCCYIHSEDGQYLTLDSYRPYLGASVVLSDFTGAFSQMWMLKQTWISSESCADTDLVNPYGEDGPYAHLRLSLLFGTTVETITADDLAAQISENENHQLVLDPSFLDDFVARLAAKYDTQGQPKRFRTSYGNEITLYEGDFGWKLDTGETRALLQENLETNQIKTLDPVWSHKGRSLDGDDAIGDSYIEVDLENQKVFLYKNGRKLLETDCVSGTLGNPERETPGGVYSIYYKNSPDTLNGPGYSEFVNYWMPFHGGYGLHDATWRSEFGGEIYKTNGSHGCINLPLKAAERIYKAVDIGYPVVLYK